MTDFSRDDSKNIFLPLALRAYDTTLNGPAWKRIGFDPIGQIVINSAALQIAIAQQKAALGEKHGVPTPSLRRLESFAHAVEKDVERNGSFFGWVAINKSSSILAITFRGTQGIDEWLKDAFILPVPYPYLADSLVEVHAGFLIVYQSVRESVLSLLETAKSVTGVLICGHSLGAAVASLCAPDIYQVLGTRIAPRVRTFASPRPADLGFAHAVTSRGISILTHRDPYDIVPTVPTLPPYFHPDTVALISGGKFLDPSFSHNLTESYQPGLEALQSDESVFDGLPTHPYIYSEAP